MATEGAMTRATASVAKAAGTAWNRVRGDAFQIVQRAAAATIAWWLARWIGDHADPFFAPIAAIVSLNQAPGERGLNALRLLIGVFIGIGAGELTLLVLSGPYVTLAVSTLLAMSAASAFGGPRIVVAQAASAAVLTVAVSDGSGGPERLIDALIGAGVALIFTQVLFTPDPVRLLHQAESSALKSMAEGLRLTSQALDTGDRGAGQVAMQNLRDLRDTMSTLAQRRSASSRVARHSLTRWHSLRPVVREQENAGHLDLLGVSCLMVTRTALTIEGADDKRLAGPISQTSRLLTELAEAPGDTMVRQGVVDRIPEVLRQLTDGEPEQDSTLDTAVELVRVVLADIMQFAGVEPQEAVAVVRQEGRQATVPTELRDGAISTLRARLVGGLRRVIGWFSRSS